MHLYVFLTCGIILSENAGHPQEDVTFTHTLNKKGSSSRLYYIHLLINFKLFILCVICDAHYIVVLIS